MLMTILAALAPVFGLILVGFACGRRAVFGGRAFEVLNRFVITLTLPVLTFRTIAHTRPADLAMPAMAAAVLGGALGIYAIAYAVERALGRDMERANIVALATGYSNTAFVGLPVVTILLGPASLGPAAVVIALNSAVVFSVGVLVGEIAAGGGASARSGMLTALRAVACNPLVLAGIAGTGWAAARLPLTGPFDTLVQTLGNATPACALIAIGLFIASANPQAERAVTVRIALLKLIGQPLLTLGLLLLLPRSPAIWSQVAVLMAATPTGTSSFVLAGRAGRWALETTARAIIVTTLLAALTMGPIAWGLLALFR